MGVRWCWQQIQFYKDPGNLVIVTGGVGLIIISLVILTNLVWCLECPKISVYFRVFPPSPSEHLHDRLANESKDYAKSAGECLCLELVSRTWKFADKLVKKCVPWRP